MSVVDRALDTNSPEEFAHRCRLLLIHLRDRPISPPERVYDPKATTPPPDLPGIRQMRRWLRDCNRYPRDEEVRGAKRLEFFNLRCRTFAARGWDVERAERERLAVQNALIEGVASFALNVIALPQYRGPRVSNEDLFQECMLHIYNAIRKYDWRTGYRLLTYVNQWYHCACHDLIYTTGRTVRITSQVQKSMKHLADAREKFGDDVAAITEATGLTAAQQRDLDMVVTGVISLSQHSGDDDDDAFTENSMPAAPSAADMVEHHQRIDLFREAMSSLPEIARRILSMRWGLESDDGEKMSYAAIGEILGLRPTTVEQLERSHMDELAREVRRAAESVENTLDD